MNKLRIFISCSGKRSTSFAIALRDWLPKILKKSKPWVYTGTKKGKQWLTALSRQMNQSQVVISCVTPENREAPWLLFEAGAVWKALESRYVCPILLDMKPENLPEPLGQFQATFFAKDEMKKLVLDLNTLLGSQKTNKNVIIDTFEERWPLLDVKVKNIRRFKLKASNEAIDSAVKAFTKHIDSYNRFDGSQVHFGGGYETQAVYNVAMSVAKKRLYVFGRKNRKLFDKDHHNFFVNLKTRINRGFDPRILFLSPKAPMNVLSSANSGKNFTKRLKSCIQTAHNMLTKSGISPSTVCRTYKVSRPNCMMVIDDAVLCSPIKIDKYGRVQPTTDAPFNIVSAKSGCGKGLLDEFLAQWNEADPLRL